MLGIGLDAEAADRLLAGGRPGGRRGGGAARPDRTGRHRPGERRWRCRCSACRPRSAGTSCTGSCCAGSARRCRPTASWPSLAQTIATLTGGLVSIEDSTSARVLAYSRSSDEVDELRRLSILGRSGPAEYLALLREWGIYDRLASSEEVLEIAEHPPSGVRRRLAVGVFAGRRQLGTIWVQQGATEFGPQAKQALLGAARLTAPYLLGSTGDRDVRSAGGLRAILAGRPDRAASRLGRVARRPCAVAVFVLGHRHRDPATAALHLDELASIVGVHALAFRRDALAEQLDGRLYLLIPNLAEPAAALGMLGTAVSAVRSHLDGQARAVLGTLAGERGRRTRLAPRGRPGTRRTQHRTGAQLRRRASPADRRVDRQSPANTADQPSGAGRPADLGAGCRRAGARPYAAGLPGGRRRCGAGGRSARGASDHRPAPVAPGPGPVAARSWSNRTNGSRHTCCCVAVCARALKRDDSLHNPGGRDGP